MLESGAAKLYVRTLRACMVDGMSTRETARVVRSDPDAVRKMLAYCVHSKRLELPARVAVSRIHRAPSHISKTVLSTVHLGPPDWTKSRTFTARFSLHV